MMKKYYAPLLMFTPFVLQAAPTMPSHLVLTPTTHSVKIQWQDNSHNETGFKIFRDKQFLKLLPKDTTSYEDTGLKALTTYAYEVRATDDGDVKVKHLFETRISNGPDDVEEYDDGWVSYDSSDLELTEDTHTQMIGLRFTSLSIPKDATITKAYIQFQTDEPSTQATQLAIYAEAADSALAFVQKDYAVSKRVKTSSVVHWSPEPWEVVNAQTSKQATPDLSSLVQEVIRRDGWESSNALAFIISGTGKRVAEAYEGKPAAAAKLYIEYTSDGSVTPPPANGEGIMISEVLAGNTVTNYDPDDKEFGDWLELYNSEDHAVNLGGYYLSDDKAQPQKWRIPDGTRITSHGYLVIWADEADKKAQALHTNFKISQDSDSLSLADTNGVVVDSLEFSKQKSDISCAKVDGKIVYMKPTPKRQNSQSFETLSLAKKPDFSLKSGFYNGTQSIELTQPNAGTIYYTTDGSIPTQNDTIYTRPISIDKTTIIRARVYEDGKFASAVKNNTYLLNENITLPVMSVGIDDAYLNGDIGLFTHYEESWLRTGSVEFIKDGKSQFSKNIGIKIHGNNTRRYPQKSLAFYAKAKFGGKSIKYPLFIDKPDIKKVKSFVLRSGGTEWGRTLMGDGVQHKIIKDMMDLEYQSYEPVIVFINGKYWGIHAIREKMNGNYLEANRHIDKDKVDLLENDAEVKEGTNHDYVALKEFIKTHDLSIDANYETIASKIDLVNYMNFIIVESFSGNSSIHHNIKYYKEQKSTGKWRWLLFDLDRGFRYADNGIFSHVADDDETSIIIVNLLKNKKFGKLFASRYFTYLNTIFVTSRMDKIITDAKDKLSPEITRHFQKWPKDAYDHTVSYDTWSGFVDKMYEVSQKRNSKYAIPQIREKFNLSGTPKLHVPKSAHGSVTVDGVPLESTFDGTYFDTATVTLKALPAAGYRFVKWSDEQTSAEIKVTLHGDVALTPIFTLKGAVVLPKVVINEFNYKSAKDFKTGDWIELYNNDNKDIDISGWELKDDKDASSYIVPANTILKAGAYKVFAEKVSDFHALVPNVSVFGDLSFGLGKTEDMIRLFDGDKNLVDMVQYDATFPDASGNGKTLSLLDPSSDNALSESWAATDNHGTPGR